MTDRIRKSEWYITYRNPSWCLKSQVTVVIFFFFCEGASTVILFCWTTFSGQELVNTDREWVSVRLQIWMSMYHMIRKLILTVTTLKDSKIKPCQNGTVLHVCTVPVSSSKQMISVKIPGTVATNTFRHHVVQTLLSLQAFFSSSTPFWNLPPWAHWIASILNCKNNSFPKLLSLSRTTKKWSSSFFLGMVLLVKCTLKHTTNWSVPFVF